MSNKKQTAVEWLVEQYEKSFNLQINKVMITIIEQAKAMEKEQIIDAARYEPFLGDLPRVAGEEYYEDNFGVGQESK